ncbi:MAG: hypothetical protein EKK48_24435 [Candidatus Melainabacteria bacterium]|jgi:hypothetical protein|nr:MAG: hypothetical protein EKK48_24435 [Candidatus Melainabacteria bacterium]
MITSFQVLSDGKPFTNDQRIELQKLVEKLDEAYLDVYDGDNQLEEKISLFMQSVTAAVLAHAVDGNEIDSLAECLYEASCTTSDDGLYWMMISNLTDELERETTL